MYNSRNYVRSWHDALKCDEIQLKVCLNWLLGEHFKGKSAHNFFGKDTKNFYLAISHDNVPKFSCARIFIRTGWRS